MARASYHHGDLRRALVERALAALEKDGELPSWRALARACGVSQSAPYRHFESADALTVAVDAEGFRQLAATIRKAKGAHRDDPRAAFEAGFRAYVHFGVTRGPLYAVMFGPDGPARRARVGAEEGADAALDAYSTLVDAVAACGVREPLPASLVLWTGHHGLVEVLRLGLAAPVMDRDQESVVSQTLAMLLAYLDTLVSSTRPEPPPRPPSARRSKRSRPLN
jgi:AcrR family transcriptional regulator